MFSYSKGYYVSPPDDQYLKFKNRCSLLFIHQLQGELEQVTLTENPDDVRKGRSLIKNLLKLNIPNLFIKKCISLAKDQQKFYSQKASDHEGICKKENRLRCRQITRVADPLKIFQFQFRSFKGSKWSH